MFSFMIISADGYHADPGQALDWQTVDQEFGQDFALAQLREAGTLVFGRVTYELMAAFWPTRAGEESDPDVAKAMNTTPKIVISQTLAQATSAGTQIISSHAEEELAKLKQQPGKDIVIPGSSTLTAGLLQTGLVDELRIMVNPVILGQGRSLFAGRRRNRPQTAEDPAVHLRQRPALLPAHYALIPPAKLIRCRLSPPWHVEPGKQPSVSLTCPLFRDVQIDELWWTVEYVRHRFPSGLQVLPRVAGPARAHVPAPRSRI